MNRTRIFRTSSILAVAALLSSAAAVASVPSAPAPQDPAAAVSLPAGPRLPQADLSSMDEAARQKVRLAQATVEQAIASGRLSSTELADNVGFLGQLYHAYKLLDAAEVCYQEARALAPGDFRWVYLVGLVRFAKGDLEPAAEDFAAALAIEPNSVPALLRRGTVMVELDRGAEAATHFERVLELEGDSAAAFYGLGEAAALAGDDPRAAELFERTLSLQPEASSVHYPLGQAYRRLGKRDEAIAQLQQRGQAEVAFEDPLARQVSRLALGTALEVLIEMAGDFDGVSDKDFLGFTLSQFGDVEGVVAQLEDWLARRASADQPRELRHRARVHYAAGGLEVQRQRDEAAIAQFRAALALVPELEDARVKLGNALARAGDFENALAEYGSVLEANPDAGDARLKRVAALMELERWPEARDDLERLVELEPRRIEVRARYGAVLDRLGDLDAALVQYRAALDLDVGPEERLRLITKVAELETARGAVESAIGAYREALALEASYAPAVAGLGNLFGALNRFSEALPLFARWAQLEPENPRPRLAEATALILGRDFAAATVRLEAAIAAFPQVLDFKDILARHLAACPEPAERDGARALTLALEVFDQVPTPQSAETLAMAYAEAGKFAEAVEWQEELIEKVRSDEVSAEVVPRLEANLQRYRQGLACCGAPGDSPD